MVPTLLRGVEVADFGKGIDHAREGARSDAAEVGFGFGKGHLHGGRVGAFWRQEREPTPGGAHGFGGFGVLVRGEGVRNDDGAGVPFRRRNLFD